MALHCSFAGNSHGGCFDSAAVPTGPTRHNSAARRLSNDGLSTGREIEFEGLLSGVGARLLGALELMMKLSGLPSFHANVRPDPAHGAPH